MKLSIKQKFIPVALSLLGFALLFKIVDSVFKENSDISSLWVIAAAIGYYLGSIPFGLILTQFFTSQDIRTIGSGNIGATNVLRTGKKKLAAITLFLDLMKGVLAIFIVQYWLLGDAIAPLFAALGSLIGHCFPVWLNFKGGKAVATAAGILLTLNPLMGLIAAGTWIATFILTKYSSLSSLLACATTLLTAYFIKDRYLLYFAIVLTILIFYRHFSNIKRLINGKESKFGK